MIENLFIEARRRRTAALHGARCSAHRHLLESYAALIGRNAAALQEDARRLDPRDRAYSPLGIVYGFCADILSNMAARHAAVPAVFRPRSRGHVRRPTAASTNKRARVEGMEVPPEPAARGIPSTTPPPGRRRCSIARCARWRARAEARDRANASGVPDARLFVDAAPEGTVLAQEHCVTSDLQRALATARPRSRRDKSSATETKDGSSRVRSRMESGSGSPKSC